jgi:hypothetical protein
MEESNMAAPESTKYQVNYKLADGTLINLYAASVTELESGLADLAMNALNIKTTGSELGVNASASAPTEIPLIICLRAVHPSLSTPSHTGEYHGSNRCFPELWSPLPQKYR